MPFNGSGTFTRVRNWVSDAAAGIKIRADYHDQEDDGFAAGLSNTITRDGQSVVTQNIPFNGKRLTSVGDPVNDQDALTKLWAQNNIVAGAHIADAPPAAAKVGNLWWDSDSGNLFVKYDDGTSTQFVQVNVSSPKPAEPGTKWQTTGQIALSTQYRDIAISNAENAVDIVFTGVNQSVTGIIYVGLFGNGVLHTTNYYGSMGILSASPSMTYNGTITAPLGYIPLTQGSSPGNMLIGNLSLRRIGATWVWDSRLLLTTGAVGGSGIFVFGNVGITLPLTGIRIGTNAAGVLSGNVAVQFA